jgi:hypothetical protein
MIPGWKCNPDFKFPEITIKIKMKMGWDWKNGLETRKIRTCLKYPFLSPAVARAARFGMNAPLHRS